MTMRISTKAKGPLKIKKINSELPDMLSYFTDLKFWETLIEEQKRSILVMTRIYAKDLREYTTEWILAHTEFDVFFDNSVPHEQNNLVIQIDSCIHDHVKKYVPIDLTSHNEIQSRLKEHLVKEIRKFVAEYVDEGDELVTEAYQEFTLAADKIERGEKPKCISSYLVFTNIFVNHKRKQDNYEFLVGQISKLHFDNYL